MEDKSYENGINSMLQSSRLSKMSAGASFYFLINIGVKDKAIVIAYWNSFGFV